MLFRTKHNQHLVYNTVITELNKANVCLKHKQHIYYSCPKHGGTGLLDKHLKQLFCYIILVLCTVVWYERVIALKCQGFKLAYMYACI